MSLLSVRNLNTGYGKKQVLFDVSLDIEEGETVMLIGANGSGKSTLFKSIFGLLPLWRDLGGNKGQILLNDSVDITNTPTYQLIQKELVYVPQQDQLYENFTVEENLEFSILNKFTEKRKIKNKIDELFDLVSGLGDKKKRKANELSGGERKFLSLAMGIINKPKLIFLDEPFAGVSIPIVDKLLHIISKSTNPDQSVVIIEHRINHIFSFFDKIIGLKQGRLLPDLIENKNDLNRIML